MFTTSTFHQQLFRRISFDPHLVSINITHKLSFTCCAFFSFRDMSECLLEADFFCFEKLILIFHALIDEAADVFVDLHLLLNENRRKFIAQAIRRNKKNKIYYSIGRFVCFFFLSSSNLHFIVSL
jgi:hypothetical protein